MSDYIPSKKTAKVLCLCHFATWLTEDGGANVLALAFTRPPTTFYSSVRYVYNNCNYGSIGDSVEWAVRDCD